MRTVKQDAHAHKCDASRCSTCCAASRGGYFADMSNWSQAGCEACLTASIDRCAETLQ